MKTVMNKVTQQKRGSESHTPLKTVLFHGKNFVVGDVKRGEIKLILIAGEERLLAGEEKKIVGGGQVLAVEEKKVAGDKKKLVSDE